MKPLHLNLAARPYRDDRPFYFGMATLVVVTAFLLINNVVTAKDYLERTRSTRAEIAEIERSIALETQKTDIAQRQIASVNLGTLNTQTSYINRQIAERAFSWTLLLDELERTVPHDVRLVTLNPTIARDGTTNLRLECVAKNQDGMVKLLRGLLGSDKFRGAFPSTEMRDENGEYKFALTVQYLPNQRMVIE